MRNHKCWASRIQPNLRAENENIIKELDQAAFGHVGLSFNNGKTIHGFGPTGSGITPEALLKRESFPGKVTDDTNIFKSAEELGLDVQITSLSVSRSQYWKGRIGVIKDRILGRFSGKRYSFPPRRNTGLTWGENCYNCATYPQSVGLPTTHPTGYLSE